MRGGAAGPIDGVNAGLDQLTRPGGGAGDPTG